MIKTDLDQRKTALILVGLGAFLIPFMGSSLSIALPLIGDDLTGNVILLGWLPMVFTLANAAFLLPFGKLADIHGRKKIFAYGVVIYTVASLLAALSPSITFLILSNFFQGLGCSMIFATGVALLSSVYPPQHRGEALGFFVTAIFIGLFLGPLLGGFLAQSLGWRSIFFFNVPLGIFLFSLIIWKLRGEWYGSKDAKFDHLGSAIYIPSLVALFYGFTAMGDTLGQAIFTAGVLGFVTFIFHETRTEYPILNIKLLTRRVSALPAVGLLFINVATTALWPLLSLYLQDILNFGPLWAALIISAQPLMVSLLSPVTGRLSDRMDGRILMVLGAVAITIGLLALSYLDIETELWWIVMGLVLVGVGMAFFAPVTTNFFMGSISRENYGMASATQSTMIYAGQTFSLGLLILIFTGFMGGVQITSANFSVFLLSLKIAFTLLAVFSGIGLVLSLFMKRPAP